MWDDLFSSSAFQPLPDNFSLLMTFCFWESCCKLHTFSFTLNHNLYHLEQLSVLLLFFSLLLISKHLNIKIFVIHSVLYQKFGTREHLNLDKRHDPTVLQWYVTTGFVIALVPYFLPSDIILQSWKFFRHIIQTFISLFMRSLLSPTGSSNSKRCPSIVIILCDIHFKINITREKINEICGLFLTPVAKTSAGSQLVKFLVCICAAVL